MTTRTQDEGRGSGQMYPGSEYTAEEVEWLKACLVYSQQHHLSFLLARDFLEIARALGYRRSGGCPACGESR